MIDLHCHILPGLDDGATDLAVALEMARAFVADGVNTVACTPHILPGLYHNTGPGIRRAVSDLQKELYHESIPLQLVSGSDNHVAPDSVDKIGSGEFLTLADSRYILIEPPHHVIPQRIETVFFELLAAGYIPVLTHPERLRWINTQYTEIQRFARAGVWMQITAGSLAGAFGANCQYWAERMLDDGYVHILATDAHDAHRRYPDLRRGRDLAARRLGEVEACHLVLTRPMGVLEDMAPWDIPKPPGLGSTSEMTNGELPSGSAADGLPSWTKPTRTDAHWSDGRGIARRVWRFLGG